MALRKIKPFPLPEGARRAKVDGKRPELRWVAPTSLLVDDVYQRDLGRKSARLIPQMVAEFSWARMKPPVVVAADGGLHVLDGQHTAIAAATLGIPQIPVFVVSAETVDARARAFVGHNTDRITVTPLAIFRALVAAGDEDSLDVEMVCKRAGVRVRAFNQVSALNVGDTMAIGSLRALIKRRGVMKARVVLEALVRARRAPITAAEVKAAESLVCDGKHGVEAVTDAIRVEGDKAIADARERATRERIPISRALMQRWEARLAASKSRRVA